MDKASPRGSEDRGPSPPIVGRSAELVLLREQLEAAAAGRGQFSIVSGEAGIGKTTLVRELIAEARRRDMLVLVGQCYDLMAAAPYGLWLDLAHTYSILDERDQPIPMPALFTGSSLRGITSQSEVFDPVRTCLADLAAHRPLLIVLEDVHWADPVSIELLRHIASRIAHLRIFLVITYRVDELAQHTPLYRQLPAMIRESGGMRIDLGRLDTGDLSSLVRLRYRLREQDEERLVGFLLDHSEGNPFFAVELLRALEQRGMDGGLWEDADGWHVGALDGLVVPALVRQVIDLRIERLGPEVREPLALAAVIGQDVPLALLQRLANTDAPALMKIVDKAVAWHVLDASADGTRVRFVHALTREALYENILPPRRRLLHREVAEALMTMPQADPDQVAFHLERAGDARTAEWMVRAGERAQRAYAWLTAWERFSSAADALAGSPGEELLRARILYRCGRLLRYADARRGLEDIRTARRLAAAAGSPVLAGEATYSQGLLHIFADDWRHGIATMADGIRQLEALPLDVAEASWSRITWIADALPSIHMASAAEFDQSAARLAHAGINHRRGGLPWFLAHAGRLEEAQEEADTYLDLAVQGEMGPLVMAASGHASFGRGIARAALGDPAGARTAFAAARAFYEPLDHEAVIAFTFLTELQDVLLRYETTDVEGRRLWAESAKASLERAGGALPSDLSVRRAELPLMWLGGRWDEARQVAFESSTDGNYVLRRCITNSISLIDYHQGRSDAVRQHIQTFLPGGPGAEPGSFVLPDALLLQQLGAAMALDEGDAVTARRWLEASRRWLEWSGAVAGWSEYWLGMARLAREIGQADEAWEAAESAVASADEPLQPLARLGALRMRGALRASRRDNQAAADDFREALALADACDAPFERALTLVEMATSGLDVGGKALAEASAIGDRLGAAPLVARIRDVVKRETSAASTNNGLTARELDVLRLAAEGLTDAEIGERLFISHRTVSQHLRSVYAKLDVHSRAAATRMAIEQQLV